MKLEKRVFGCNETKYLGFKLTQKGVKVDDTKTELVLALLVMQSMLLVFWV